jgi:DNA-binding NtrC family response regulator
MKTGIPVHVLLVDDEKVACESTADTLERLGYRVSTLLDLEQVAGFIVGESPDILLLDVEFPGDRLGGVHLLQQLRKAGHLHPTIFLSHLTGVDTVVEASRQGMVTYLEKDAPEDQLVAALREATSVLPQRYDPDQPMAGQMLGSSPAFQEALQTCLDFAPLVNMPVLLTGETGSGKSMVARLIHQASPRRDGPFQEQACPNITEQLADSILFGHCKGSFTQAYSDTPGVFESADGGTLFLDEFADLPYGVQLKLLRVLDTGDYNRVGDPRTRHSTARLILATNQDIPAKIQRGEFRADLWHRIAGLVVHMPPLRDRREDIATLANYFVAHFVSGLPGRAHVLSPNALRVLERYDWTGNIRELDWTIKSICARSKTISIEDWQVENALPLHPSKAVPAKASAELLLPDRTSAVLPWKEYKARKELEYFHRVVELTGGIISHAAELAGVDRKKIYEVRGSGSRANSRDDE